MNRREFVVAAGALGLHSFSAYSQGLAPRFADMHAHLGFKPEQGYRAQMEKGGMLLVAEQVTPDSPLIRRIGGRLLITREASAGELRNNFDRGFAARRAAARQEGLVEIISVEALDRVLAERTPGLVLSVEGSDFLEADLSYLGRIREQGLVHLQLVHYYGWSRVGDISTEQGTHGGLTAFGKDVVRTCNRIGILVDLAHCTNQAMEQALEESGKPVIYSHGHVSAGLPNATLGGSVARAIHAPVAKKIADRGGVVGIWPDWFTYANTNLLADAIARTAEQLGASHVGIGSDMHGLTRTIMPDYAEFAALEGALAKRGLKAADIEGILGGNYVRVLREAMTV